MKNYWRLLYHVPKPYGLLDMLVNLLYGEYGNGPPPPIIGPPYGPSNPWPGGEYLGLPQNPIGCGIGAGAFPTPSYGASPVIDFSSAIPPSF